MPKLLYLCLLGLCAFMSVGFFCPCAYAGVTCALSLYMLQVHASLWSEAPGGVPDLDVAGNTEPRDRNSQGQGRGGGGGEGGQVDESSGQLRAELPSPAWRLGVPATCER